MGMQVLILLLLLGLLGLGVFLAALLTRQGRRLMKLEFGVEGFDKALDKSSRGLEESLARNREEAGRGAREGREELGATLKNFQEGLAGSVRDASKGQADQLALFASQLGQMGRDSEARLEKMRTTIEASLRELQADNNQKLEQIGPPWTRSFSPRWRSAWATALKSSAKGWRRCTRAWAKCRAWPAAWAT